MLDGDALGDGQAEARALRLGGRIGLEEARRHPGGDAGAVVGDGDGNVRVAVRGGGDGDLRAGAVAHGVERVLDEVREHLDDLIAVGADGGQDARAALLKARAGRGRPLQLNHVAYHLVDVDLLQARRREAREAGELGHDAGDAVHLVEHGARRLVEVVVEGRVVSRAQAPERLHRRADGRQRVLDLVRHAAGHLAPGRDARGGGQAATGDGEVLDHAVEREGQLGDLARSADAQRARLVGGHLPRLAREIGDGAPQAARQQDREEERRPGRRYRRQEDGAIDPRQVLVQLGLRLGDRDGERRPGRVDQRAARLRGVLGGGRGDGRHGHADVERDAEPIEQGGEMTHAEEPRRVAALAAAATDHQAGGSLGAEGEVRVVALECILHAIAGLTHERARVGPEHLAGVGDQRELVQVEGLALLGDQRGQGHAPLVELTLLD